MNCHLFSQLESLCYELRIYIFFTLVASSGKRNVGPVVWRPSVCLSLPSATRRDSPGGSMRRGQRTFRPDNKEDQHNSSFFTTRRPSLEVTLTMVYHGSAYATMFSDVTLWYSEFRKKGTDVCLHTVLKKQMQSKNAKHIRIFQRNHDAFRSGTCSGRT